MSDSYFIETRRSDPHCYNKYPPTPTRRANETKAAVAMAVTGKRGVGIPTILLHDGEGTIVSIELKTGETYRGFLDETEDNMNCVLKDAVRTELNGSTTHVEQVYIRGGQILFIIFPDIYPSPLSAMLLCICIICKCMYLLVFLDLVVTICTLKHAPMFKRVKLWKKHKGSIPALGQGGPGGGGPRGQAAAIIRKGTAFGRVAHVGNRWFNY
ncbi:40s ribosomal protein s16, partial [Globisporangium splendens]